MSHSLFERHRKTLESAVEAIARRGYWGGYPEVPSGKIYGETAKKDGAAAFQARRNKPFSIDQPGTIGTVGDEASPYGLRLGITYPTVDLNQLLPVAQQAMRSWRDAGIETRTGVCLEILHCLNRRSFEMANAVMHTTGQGFMMAFQAGGPHAQDRGLEAVAYAYAAMKRCPVETTWKKQVAKDVFVTLNKRFRLIPRGVAAVVGCSTFPTWNTYPGLFASLVTGNAVVVKPHHGAILPLAITVEIARDVIQKAGFDANLMTLVVSGPGAPSTKDLVTRPEIQIVDYTGSSEFGDWIERNATQAVVFTEKAGINSAVLDSADDLKAVAKNLAFTLSLYSGQMCTTPQNIFIPKDGIQVGGRSVSFDEVAMAITGSLEKLLSDPQRAADILGAIQNEETLQRIERAATGGGQVLLASRSVSCDAFPEARIRTPLILKVDASQKDHYMREVFGPVSYLVATESTDESLRLAVEVAQQKGAITGLVYSTDSAVLQTAEEMLTAAGVALSCNLTGVIFVNQAAAFSDFHVSGVNPAGNATLCDDAFVASRFRMAQSRIPVTTEAAAAVAG